MKMGLEVLLNDKKLQEQLRGKKLGWLCHAASVNFELQHSLDLVIQHTELNITCAFGPQHGILAEKQDNMIESEDFIHPQYQIPVYSLYGEYRRPTKKMFDNLDVLIVDLQDVGCRIYTFLTSLFYCMEAASEWKKKVIVLDRPNPAGRFVEGNLLDMNWASFVGAAPIPMRYGWTLGEAGNWYKDFKRLDLEYEVVKMTGYAPGKMGPYDWHKDYSWVNPSPNIPRVSCTQMYPGTVLIEGTLLSEGRGTTLPLEMFGAPGVDPQKVINKMLEVYPGANSSCLLRACYFEPTFHKHKGDVCGGVQIHVDHPHYNPENFKPYRIIATYFKALHLLYPDLFMWRKPPYEYEYEKMPIDLLSGNDFLRNWVDDKVSTFSDLDNYLLKDEKVWLKNYREYFLY
ncbi:MAG: DUF1343 domain-containing protein [Bdellovibrionaceae bacterium]|nr:DUF1343 domain-containing protein [Pseudobdellovibrionaceae bacterium]